MENYIKLSDTDAAVTNGVPEGLIGLIKKGETLSYVGFNSSARMVAVSNTGRVFTKKDDSTWGVYQIPAFAAAPGNWLLNVVDEASHVLATNKTLENSCLLPTVISLTWTGETVTAVDKTDNALRSEWQAVMTQKAQTLAAKPNKVMSDYVTLGVTKLILQDSGNQRGELVAFGRTIKSYVETYKVLTNSGYVTKTERCFYCVGYFNRRNDFVRDGSTLRKYDVYSSIFRVTESGLVEEEYVLILDDQNQEYSALFTIGDVIDLIGLEQVDGNDVTFPLTFSPDQLANTSNQLLLKNRYIAVTILGTGFSINAAPDGTVTDPDTSVDLVPVYGMGTPVLVTGTSYGQQERYFQNLNLELPTQRLSCGYQMIQIQGEPLVGESVVPVSVMQIKQSLVTDGASTNFPCLLGLASLSSTASFKNDGLVGSDINNSTEHRATAFIKFHPSGVSGPSVTGPVELVSAVIGNDGATVTEDGQLVSVDYFDRIESVVEAVSPHGRDSILCLSSSTSNAKAFYVPVLENVTPGRAPLVKFVKVGPDVARFSGNKLLKSRTQALVANPVQYGELFSPFFTRSGKKPGALTVPSYSTPYRNAPLVVGAATMTFVSNNTLTYDDGMGDYTDFSATGPFPINNKSVTPPNNSEQWAAAFLVSTVNTGITTLSGCYIDYWVTGANITPGVEGTVGMPVTQQIAGDDYHHNGGNFIVYIRPDVLYVTNWSDTIELHAELYDSFGNLVTTMSKSFSETDYYYPARYLGDTETNTQLTNRFGLNLLSRSKDTEIRITKTISVAPVQPAPPTNTMNVFDPAKASLVHYKFGLHSRRGHLSKKVLKDAGSEFDMLNGFNHSVVDELLASRGALANIEDPKGLYVQTTFVDPNGDLQLAGGDDGGCGAVSYLDNNGSIAVTSAIDSELVVTGFFVHQPIIGAAPMTIANTSSVHGAIPSKLRVCLDGKKPLVEYGTVHLRVWLAPVDQHDSGHRESALFFVKPDESIDITHGKNYLDLSYTFDSNNISPSEHEAELVFDLPKVRFRGFDEVMGFYTRYSFSMQYMTIVVSTSSSGLDDAGIFPVIAPDFKQPKNIDLVDLIRITNTTHTAETSYTSDVINYVGIGPSSITTTATVSPTTGMMEPGYVNPYPIISDFDFVVDDVNHVVNYSISLQKPPNQDPGTNYFSFVPYIVLYKQGYGGDHAQDLIKSFNLGSVTATYDAGGLYTVTGSFSTVELGTQGLQAGKSYLLKYAVGRGMWSTQYNSDPQTNVTPAKTMIISANAIQ